MPSYTYLVPHATEPRFKLGKGNFPYNRLSNVAESNGGYELDWDRAVLLKVDSEGEAIRLEASLRKNEVCS
jgi:hypothetical protein